MKFSRIHEIDDQVFDSLYEESKELVNANYPWHLYIVPLDDEIKKKIIRNSFEQNMQDGLAWQVESNEKILLLCAGTIEGNLIRWNLGLSGTDENGSRAWLYDENYAIERDKFWDLQGVDGWIMSQASEGKGIHNHILNKNPTGMINANVEIKPSSMDGFLDIIITKQENENG